MITIAIVEDEEAYAKQLTEYIEKYQQESGKRLRYHSHGYPDAVYGWDDGSGGNPETGYQGSDYVYHEYDQLCDPRL